MILISCCCVIVFIILAWTLGYEHGKADGYAKGRADGVKHGIKSQLQKELIESKPVSGNFDSELHAEARSELQRALTPNMNKPQSDGWMLTLLAIGVVCVMVIGLV